MFPAPRTKTTAVDSQTALQLARTAATVLQVDLMFFSDYGLRKACSLGPSHTEAATRSKGSAASSDARTTSSFDAAMN
jgi:hypothetical protein